MDIATLLEKIRDTLAADADCKEFCQAKYGKDPLVYLGVDDDNPPPQDQYPVIVVFSVNRVSRGDGDKFITYNANIGVGIVNETVTTVDNKITLPGLVEAEALRQLVEAALFGQVGHKLSVIGDTATEVIFPLFRSDTIVEIQYLKSSRMATK